MSNLLCIPPWTGADARFLDYLHIAGSVLVGAALLVGGCVEERARQDTSEASATKKEHTPARRLAVQCKRSEGEIVTFRALVRPDSLTLRVPAQLGGGTHRLSSVRAASGAKYEGGNVMVWSKGDSALVEVDGQHLQDCTLAPQTESREEEQRPGMQFRAIGQEPGWLVEITNDSLRFTWAYGQHEVTAPRPDREMDAGRILYSAKTDRDTVRVVAKPQQCTDPMNGRLFSHTVTVTLAGDTHTGCGRPLP